MQIAIRTLTSTLVGLALGWASSAQAYVDVGSTHGIPTVVDAITGLTWVRVSGSPDEGVALGFRVATAEEFSTFLGNTSWVTEAGPGQQFSLQAANQLAAPPGGEGSSATRLPVQFRTETYKYESYFPDGWSYFNGFAGLLADGQVGVVSDQGRWFTIGAPNGGPPVHTIRALIGNLDAFKAGAYDTTTMKWSDATVNSSAIVVGATQANPGQWMYHPLVLSPAYFMVLSAVPEPSTWALMGLGLIAMAVAVRRPSGRVD